MEKITWNSADFLREYHEQTARVERGDSLAYNRIKSLRSAEFANTVALVSQGYYETEDGKKVVFPPDAPMRHGTKFYEKPFHVSAPAAGRTAVEVASEDCLQAAVRLKEEGFNPAVLNMASRRNPGGGVTTGAGAQEETLFRRTNLFRSLFQFAAYAGRYGVPKSRHQYPLDRNFGGIYTPNALLFRKSEHEGYALMEQPVGLSFVSVAGMNRPELTDGLIADSLIEPVKNKMRTILRIGLEHGHDSLVLGALGCGAFRNPPRHVARLFHEVIGEEEFAGKYRLLAFAILEDHNAHKSHNPEGNFKPFAEEFKGMGRLATRRCLLTEEHGGDAGGYWNKAFQKMKYNIEQLRKRQDWSQEDFVFFWSHTEKPGRVTKACLSQWYPGEFEVDGQVYNCAEQYMMAEKARLFGDEEIRQQILAETGPKNIKWLGHKVRNYDEATWSEVRYNVVLKGNIHKFAQDIKLRQFLHGTEDKILVEASPYDQIWGIGMDERHADAIHPGKWLGTNLLGFALMEVRSTLRQWNSIYA